MPKPNVYNKWITYLILPGPAPRLDWCQTDCCCDTALADGKTFELAMCVGLGFWQVACQFRIMCFLRFIMSFLGESLQTWGEEERRQDLHRSQSLPEVFMHSCGACRCGIIETLIFLNNSGNWAQNSRLLFSIHIGDPIGNLHTGNFSGTLSLSSLMRVQSLMLYASQRTRTLRT